MSFTVKLAGPLPNTDCSTPAAAPPTMRPAAGGAGRRGVRGVHGRRVQRRPAGVALGGIVAVLVAVADRRDRAPEVVVELRIPLQDERVTPPHSKQREEARVVGEAEAARSGELRGGLEPA